MSMPPPDSAAGAETAQRLGPFVLGRPLGSGAMGMVYQAVHERTQERVAVKTVFVREPLELQSLRREVRILRRLEHPAVVRILSEGVTDAPPWYAMELLEGGTLADYLSSLSSAESRIRQRTELLRVIRRVCSALAFVHGQGVVHGDLKPANIFLRADGRPVLFDFGLSWRFSGAASREVLDEMTGVAGTPAYMAPEQITGEAIDARADLYAVGCILFEALTGRAPFESDSWGEILDMHLLTKAPPPSSIEPAAATFDGLVAALLEKNRKARLGHALDAIRELEHLGIADEDTAGPPPAAYVYKPGLSGRESVLAELTAAGASAADGHGGFCLITGESGVGKTYVAAEALRRCTGRLDVIVGACSPVTGSGGDAGGQALEPLRRLLQRVADHCVTKGQEAAQRLLGSRGPLLAAYEPALFNVSAIDEAAPPAAGATQLENVMAALRHVISGLAAEHPLVLMLDDLQWADELTLRFLRSLPAGWFTDRRLLLVATVRSEEMPADVEAIARRSDVRVLELPGLGASTIGDLVRDMLAVDRVPDVLAHRLCQQSAGNPFYVAEFLRTALAAGLLERVSQHELRFAGETADVPGLLDRLPLPRSLHDLIGRRLGRLDEPARRLALVGALMGREFDLDVARAIAGLSEEAGLDAATALLRLQIVEPAAGARLRFVHDKLTEVAAAQVEPQQRRSLHREIALALQREAGDGVPEPGHWARLAHHWREAREPERELPCTDKAAEEALAAAAFADAARLYRRAIDLVGAGTGRGSPLAGSDRSADRECAVALAEEALGNSVAVERHARRTLGHLGWTVPETGTGWARLVIAQAARQLALLLRGSTRAGTAAEVRARQRRGAQAASLLTGRYFYSDNAAGMLGSALMSVNLAETAGDDTGVPRSYLALGLFAGFLGLERLANRYFAKSLRGAEARRDPAERAFHLVGLSAYDSSGGRWQLAEESIRRAVSLLDDVEAVDPFVREVVRTQLGHVDHFLGRYEDAIGDYQQVLSSARARGNRQTTNWGLFSIGRSLLPLGRVNEAQALLEEAWAGLTEQPEIQSEIICLGLMASAQSRLGDRRAAVDRADETLARVAQARSLGFPAAEGYSGAIEVYLDAMGAWPAERRSLEARAHRAVRAFGRLARLLPAAAPLYRWRAGQLAQACGRMKRAERDYRAALEAASRQGLPRETALAHWALAQLPGIAGSEGDRHRQVAERIAAEIGLALQPQGF